MVQQLMEPARPRVELDGPKVAVSIVLCRKTEDLSCREREALLSRRVGIPVRSWFSNGLCRGT